MEKSRFVALQLDIEAHNAQVDEAINRLLRAEHEARAAVDVCRGQARDILEEARRRAKRIRERTEYRLTRVQRIADRSVEKSISTLRRRSQPLPVDEALSDEQLTRLKTLIHRLVVEMIG